MKPVSALSVGDLAEHSVWRYSGDDDHDETMVRPIGRLPVSSLTGKLVGARVLLANGTQVWALIGNIDSQNQRLNEHFVTISIEHEGRWFHLARYHDHDFGTRGPAELAEFLGIGVDDIFPISYDIRRFVVGHPDALKGTIGKEPSVRLTRAEIIALAVP